MRRKPPSLAKDGTTPTRQTMLDLAESLRPDYSDRTEKQQAAAKVKKELDEFIDNNATVKKLRALHRKLYNAAEKERAEFTTACNRLKHLTLALGLCKETSTAAKKLVEMAEKIGLKTKQEMYTEDDD